MRIRKRGQILTPIVRRYAGEAEFDADRPGMTAQGMHVASIGTDPAGELRVVWSPHRRYSIELRGQREIDLRGQRETVEPV